MPPAPHRSLLPGATAAGLFLRVALPTELGVGALDTSLAAVDVEAWVAAGRGGGDGRDLIGLPQPLRHIRLGCARGYKEMLPLQAPAQQTPASDGGGSGAATGSSALAAWARHIVNGRIRGCVTLFFD